MSDTTPTPPTPDATPTEALELADQQPVAADAPPASATAPAAAPRAGGGHTRTILEVIGGVVAAGLIVVAGAVGFAVGHATGDDDGRWSMTRSDDGWSQGPEAGGPMGGGQGPQDGQGFGDRGGDEGYGDRGHRGDGDRDGRGMGPGQQGDRGQGMGPGQQDLDDALPAPAPAG